MSDDKKIDRALAEILPHLRDVSLRDGIQSWDGNRWRIDDILPVATEINRLAQVVDEELGVKMAPAEIWGGGQVLQPALYLKEDPFQNLERLKQAMPDLELQSLYRGRQGYAFKPLSDEVQRAAIKESADRGIQVFRIFDMMNDLQNVKTGIEAVKEYKPRFEQEHPGQHLTIEGAVCYISEPEGKPRAWTLEEYGHYAVKLAKMGADEIVIKNYAGVGDKEMPDLAKTIRAKLDEAGFGSMKINLHSHGQKPALFADMLSDTENGKPRKPLLDKADVAIGELSGGPAHTNIRKVIMLMLEEKGITDVDAINQHPVMQQLAQVEARIHTIVHREQEFAVNGHTMTDTFDNRRGPLKELEPDKIERYRMAQGALSDLAGKVKGQDPRMFGEVLQKASELWERAGRFNTVTPGAMIVIDQALHLNRKPLMSQTPINMTDYNDDFIKVVTGRFGRNQGMEKEGVGDVAWRDGLLMFKALERLNDAVATNALDPTIYQSLISQTGFGTNGLRPMILRADRVLREDKNRHRPQQIFKKGTIDLMEPRLEQILATNVPLTAGDTTIKRFRKVISASSMPDNLKSAVLAELEPGRSPTPTDGVAEGQKVVDRLKARGGEAVAEFGKRLDEYGGVLAMLLRNGNDSIFESIFGGTNRLPPSSGHSQTANR